MQSTYWAMPELEEELIARLKDTHAIESSILELLGRMMEMTKDGEAREALARHRLAARHHRQRLRERLQTLGERPHLLKDRSGLSRRRGSQTDGFIAMHLKTASYVLLEAIAAQVEDEQTVQVSRLNRVTDEELSRLLACRMS